MTLSYRMANMVLAVSIVGINCYTIAAPLFPGFGQDSPKIAVAPVVLPSERPSGGGVTGDYQLVIPSIGLVASVAAGNSDRVLKEGLWMRPTGSDPAAGGNTVIAGHRFTYRSGSPFYYLVDVKPGDRIQFNWRGHRYYYRVTQTKVVEPSEVSIEGPSIDHRLTLYTCTPLGTAQQRFVVIAELLEKL